MFKIVHYFFWGILLILLNINIRMGSIQLDLLPDTIGYIFIIIAFNELARLDRRFTKGSIFAAVNLMLHLIKVFAGSLLAGNMIMGVVLTLGIAILRLCYIFYIHEAVAYIIDERLNLTIPCEMQQEISWFDVNRDSRWQSLKIGNETNWKGYLYLGIINCILMPFSINGFTPFVAIGVISIIGILIVEIGFLVILDKIKKQLIIEKAV